MFFLPHCSQCNGFSKGDLQTPSSYTNLSNSYYILNSVHVFTDLILASIYSFEDWIAFNPIAFNPIQLKAPCMIPRIQKKEWLDVLTPDAFVPTVLSVGTISLLSDKGTPTFLSRLKYHCGIMGLYISHVL